MSQTDRNGGARALSRVLCGTAALGVIFAAVPALAQSTAGAPVQTSPVTAQQSPVTAAAQPAAPVATAPGPQGAEAETVVVTGSLIRRANTETASPVTQLSSDFIAKEGITNVTDAIRSVAADNSGSIPNSFSNGFAAGASGASLRGLTAADTLVLIDGLRTAAYPVADDGVRSFVDLNTIPIGVVDHVDVLKDGASALYGSDAVAGVVNIIMKQTFQGFQADASYGGAEHGGGTEVRANALYGYGDLGTQGWNAYVDLEYQTDGQIAAGQRDFPFNTNDLSSIGGANNIGGQPTHFSGSTFGSVAPVLDAAGDTGPYQVLRPGGCGRGATTTTDAGGTYCAQNFVPYGDDQPAEQRWGVYGRFTKQLGPQNQAFVNVYYYDNKTNVYGAPQQLQSSAPFNTEGQTIPALLSNGQLNPNNPFAAAGQAAALNYAFGDIPFSSTFDNKVIRGTFGVKGDLFGFNYETDVTIAHSALDTVDNGYINVDQLNTDIADGAYSFINPASNSAATLAALSPTRSKVSTSDLDTFDIHASRALYQLPGGPLSLALGGQVRYEAISDPFLNTANLDGSPTASSVLALGLADTQGHRYVGAFFFQVDAPVIRGLDVGFQGRYDHYSDFGGNFVPKIELTYQPFINTDIPWLRQTKFRSTYGQGFRAPSFSQNGSSESEGFVNYNVPTSFATAHGNDGYVAQYTLAELSVANPNIQPEKSETFTAGFIIEPDRHINASVDYYHIRQTGIIAQLSVNEVLADYYAGAALPQGASVTPDSPDASAKGALARPLVVSSPFVNANDLTTDGVDVDIRANYTLPFNVKYTSDFSATDIFEYEYTLDDQTFNYVGTEAPYNLSSGAGTPKYRVNWLNSFTWDRLTVNGTLNFISGFKQTGADVTSSSDVAGACLYTDNSAADNPFPRSCHVKSFWDIDLTNSYKLTNTITAYFDVLNLTDKGPSLNPANYAGAGSNYNPTWQQDGIVGRFFRVGVKVKY